MLGLSGWASFLAVIAAATAAWLLGRFSSERASAIGAWVDAALLHRFAPWIVGVVTAGVVLYAWGGLARIPVISDEAAYVLQAQLFAKGAWAAPAAPIPEFFEQSHVLVTPALASKYPPGHSLMLAPGALVSLPALPVLIMNGVAGAFIFLLARRAAGPRVALLTWVVWASCFPLIYFRATYLSKVTTSAAWLVAWWCLWQWRSTGARKWMVGVAASVGLVAITRPLTAVALAIPIGIAVVIDSARARSWKDLGVGVAVGTAVLCVIPIWSMATLGTVSETPLAVYRRVYLPFTDNIGFGYDTTKRPERALPGTQEIANKYKALRIAHTPDALPGIAMERARMIARDLWYEWRLGLAPFAAAALLFFPAAAWFALATLVLHVGLYLLYAAPPGWTVYYTESVPILAFASALGIVRALESAARDGLRRRSAGPVDSAPPMSAGIAVIAIALVALVPSARTWGYVRAQIDGDHSYFERFAALTRTIPDERAVLFVRYAPTHNHDLSVVRNPPGHAEAKLWIAYDRGAENRRLLELAPDRRPYLFDESSWTIVPLNPTPAP